MASADVRDFRDQATRPREDTAFQITTGGSIGGVIGGIATIILSIIGLSYLTRPFDWTIGAITAIVLGCTLVVLGAAVAARFIRLFPDTAGGRLGGSRAVFSGGMSTEVLGGVTGIVLGILAILNIAPMVLLPVTAIVFGVLVILGCSTTARLNSLVAERTWAENDVARQMVGEMMNSASGAQALVGLAAIILGVIGVVGVVPLTLSLVAFLCLGAGVLLSSVALGGRMMSLLSR